MLCLPQRFGLRRHCCRARRCAAAGQAPALATQLAQAPSLDFAASQKKQAALVFRIALVSPPVLSTVQPQLALRY